MRRYVPVALIVAVTLVGVCAPVKADMPPGPRPRQPWMPAGPDSATIRGVQVQQGYEPGPRPVTVLSGCDFEQHICREKKLLRSTCFIVGLDGHAIPGGDIAALLALEAAAHTAPIKLILEGCGDVPEIELVP
jgi:hypothetical protein